jgi:uncharacterized protein YndB with AHSA1/START domain
MNGVLEDLGGRWRLRFVRELDHPRELVWRAITEKEHLRAWFPDEVTGAWVPGGALTFGSDQAGEFGGEVLAVEPPSLLEFRWGTDVLRLEVAEREGGCTLTLLDTFDEQGKAARDAAGWHECLDRLGAHLDGQDASWPAGERWEQVHPRYVARFGPAGSSIGPPAGG